MARVMAHNWRTPTPTARASNRGTARARPCVQKEESEMSEVAPVTVEIGRAEDWAGCVERRAGADQRAGWGGFERGEVRTMNAIPVYEGCGHGHVFPTRSGAKARCGGPAICSKCAADKAYLESQLHGGLQSNVETAEQQSWRLEAGMWRPTPELRWYRPARGDNNDRVLQQLWQRVTGERTWRAVDVVLED